MITRPKPDQKLVEAMMRLRHNVDFQLLTAHMEAELEYQRAALVELADDGAFRSMQGRARQLTELLKLIHSKKE